jgi:hypothetical protein
MGGSFGVLQRRYDLMDLARHVLWEDWTGSGMWRQGCANPASRQSAASDAPMSASDLPMALNRAV